MVGAGLSMSSLGSTAALGLVAMSSSLRQTRGKAVMLSSVTFSTSAPRHPHPSLRTKRPGNWHTPTRKI